MMLTHSHEDDYDDDHDRDDDDGFSPVAQSCRVGWLPHGVHCYLYKHKSFTFFEAKVSLFFFFFNHWIALKKEKMQAAIKIEV